MVTVWAVGILLLAMFVASRTRFGRYIYAIGGGEKVARLSGINIERQKFAAFAVSGFLAGFAALLLIFRLQAATPSMGSSYLLTSIAAVVIGGTALSGGIGGPHKTVLGVLVIAILSNGMDVVSVQPFVQTLVMGAVVILAVGLTINRASLSLIK
ncbi:Xylose transport system permease protein XylH [compost metagenome]